jgi:microcystin-dependent protein
MGFTRSTADIIVHQKLGDYPNQDDGLSADELKKRYDYPAETLQKDLNKLETELESETAAASLGATALDENDASAKNVDAKLKKIYTEFKEVRDGAIKDGSLVTSKIQDGAITNNKIAEEAVSTNKIENSAVTTDKIADQNVTTNKIADGAVTGEKVDAEVKKAANITAEKMSDNDTSEGNVQEKLNKLAYDLTRVSQGGVADGAITTEKVVDMAITKNKVANGAISTEKIEDDAITTSKVVDGAITKAKIDFELFLVPSGFIGMWSGYTVPTGWLLCDGTNGTPDLRNRFVVGSGSDYTIGDKGGEKTHVLTKAEMPAHTHTLDIAAESYDTRPTHANTLMTYESKESVYYGEMSGGDWSDRHYEILSTVGSGAAHENRPPYYALAFIMKA